MPLGDVCRIDDENGAARGCSLNTGGGTVADPESATDAFKRMWANPGGLQGYFMDLPTNALVAVVDGQKLLLFRNGGDEKEPKLNSIEVGKIDDANRGSGGHHASSSANPDDHQQDEDGFAAGVAALLNRQVLDGKIDDLLVIAAPRTLGELRKHYHKSLSAKLVGEIAKDLTGADAAAIEKAIAAA